MLSFYLKRHKRLLTTARRYVAEIYQQTRNNYHLQKQHQQQQQQPHIIHIHVPKNNRMLEFNQAFYQRAVFNLELYHKNVLKKFQQTFYKKFTTFTIHKNFIDTDIR